MPKFPWCLKYQLMLLTSLVPGPTGSFMGSERLEANTRFLIGGCKGHVIRSPSHWISTVKGDLELTVIAWTQNSEVG